MDENLKPLACRVFIATWSAIGNYVAPRTDIALELTPDWVRKMPGTLTELDRIVPQARESAKERDSSAGLLARSHSHTFIPKHPSDDCACNLSV